MLRAFKRRRISFSRKFEHMFFCFLPEQIIGRMVGFRVLSGLILFLKLQNSTLTESDGSRAFAFIWRATAWIAQERYCAEYHSVSCRNGFQKFHLLYAHVVLWKES